MRLQKLHKKINEDRSQSHLQMKEFQEHIREYEEKFKVMFEMVPASVFLETLDGQIVDCNQEAVKMSGYRKSELLKMTAVDLVPPEVAKSFPKLVQTELKTGGFRRQTYNKRKNGEIYPADVIGKIINIKGRKYVIIIVNDLSGQFAAQKEVAESEERFKLIFDLAPDAYFLTNLKGQLVGGNRAVEKLTGYSRFDLIGKDLIHAGLLKKKDVSRALEVLRINLAGKPTGPDEFELVCKDGREVMAELSTHPVKIGDEYLVLSIVRDVTARKNIEKELIIKDETLELMIENIPSLIMFTDPDGKITYVSPQVKKILGYSQDYLIGTGFPKVIHPDDEEKVKNAYLSALRGNEVADLEYRFYRKDGSVAWLSHVAKPLRENGKFRGVLSFVREITEWKQSNEDTLRRNIELEEAQKKLRTNLNEAKHNKEALEILAKDLEKYKLAVEGASDHIIITDIDANIVFANRAAENITGFLVREMIGKNPGDLWGGQMDKVFFKKMWRIIKKEKKIYRGELKNKRKNGEIYDAELHIAPILDKRGNVIFFVGIERDISKMKELDRMRNEFVSIASHQLRTPLTSIKWFAELLLTAGNHLHKKDVNYIHNIYESNQKMIRLVNDLLSVSRIETGRKFAADKHRADLSALIKHAVSDEKMYAMQMKVRIETHGLPKKYIAFIDDEQIYQVFQNLLHNAITYSSPDGGRVVVSFEANDDKAIISVRDFGIGIPAKQQGRVFEKFFRGDNVAESGKAGTGLGLYIAKAIVESHGGRIRFESTENKGTTFFIELPQKVIHKK